MKDKGNTLRALLVDELRDLYDAESRLVKALPKMAKATNSDELRSGIEEHLEQTKEHVERLKQAITSLSEKVTGKKCAGMTGIIEEGAEMLDEDFEGAVLDAAIISAAQRVEHYEIAAYGCVHAWAEVLGEDKIAQLLGQTLDEEKLTELSEKINTQANSGQEDEEEEEDESESDDAMSVDEDESVPVNRGRSRSKTAGA